MTKIAIHSDLHMELQGAPMYWLEFTPDILVLAGDVHKACDIQKILPLLTEFRPNMDIVFVPGNHEYYGCKNMIETEQALREEFSKSKQIHFLQCDSKVVQGVRFIGCTGWTTLSALKNEEFPNVEPVIADRINDFHYIGMGDHKFSTQECIELGHQQREWLKQQLQATQDEKLPSMVVTHFSPSLQFRNKQHSIDEITAYFCNEHIDLIDSYAPDYWVFGHTHFNVDEIRGRTRIISNQHG
ncbi:metallophosphoesterase, partial [Oleiphilus sp. HI0117]